MTPDGNHGGASHQETHAALLMYSAAGVMSNVNNLTSTSNREVDQVLLFTPWMWVSLGMMYCITAFDVVSEGMIS